jgi:hypothetical protein
VFAGGYALLWWWVSNPRETHLTEAGADFIEGVAMAPMVVMIASILFPSVGNSVMANDRPILVGASVMAVLALIERGLRRRRGGASESSDGAERGASNWGTRAGIFLLTTIMAAVVYFFIRVDGDATRSGELSKAAGVQSPGQASVRSPVVPTAKDGSSVVRSSDLQRTPSSSRSQKQQLP